MGDTEKKQRQKEREGGRLSEETKMEKTTFLFLAIAWKKGWVSRRAAKELCGRAFNAVDNEDEDDDGLSAFFYWIYRNLKLVTRNWKEL